MSKNLIDSSKNIIRIGKIRVVYSSWFRRNLRQFERVAYVSPWDAIENRNRKVIHTAEGDLFRPLPEKQQNWVLLAALLVSLWLGNKVASVPGDLSFTAQLLMHLPYLLILVMGYSLWVTRGSALAFALIGESFMKAFKRLVSTESIAELDLTQRADEDKLASMAVQGQQAARSFVSVAWPIAMVASVMALMFDTEVSSLWMFICSGGSCLLWGYLLFLIGRRGILPTLEQ